MRRSRLYFWKSICWLKLFRWGKQDVIQMLTHKHTRQYKFTVTGFGIFGIYFAVIDGRVKDSGILLEGFDGDS